MIRYVTFGQDHSHDIGDKHFDKDCVAIIEGNRDTVFELFGPKFCMEYTEAVWDEPTQLPCFPRGYVKL